MSVASSEQDDQPVQGKLSANSGFFYVEHAFPDRLACQDSTICAPQIFV